MTFPIHRLKAAAFGLLMLALAAAQLPAQVISTLNGPGTLPQLLKNLDGVESTWEVINARGADSGQEKGNAHSNQELPDDRSLAQQMEQAMGPLSIPFDRRIRDYVEIFAQSRRSNTEAMLGLASLYLPMIERRLEEMHMPRQLAMLPAALSCFNQLAVSEEGLAGLWQLNYHLAIRYGLRCDNQIDERRDPYLSTRAAIAYLADLHALYKDWPLTVAAYTAGPAGINRARNRAGLQAGFKEIYPFLPAEQRENLLSFAAAAFVMDHAKSLGLTALPMESMPLPDRIVIQEPLKFAHVSNVLGIPENELRNLNPVCRTEMIPGFDIPIQLCLPNGYGARFQALKDSIYKEQKRLETTKPEPVKSTMSSPEGPEKPIAEKPKPEPAKPYAPPAGHVQLQYTIQPGDNLGLIARWYGLSLTELKQQNNLKTDRINAGDQLNVYVPKSASAKLAKIASMSFEDKQASVGLSPSAEAPKPAPEKPVSTGNYSYYTVKSGDNLWAIAKKYPGVSAEDIMKANGIGEKLDIGMKLKIPKQ